MSREDNQGHSENWRDELFENFFRENYSRLYYYALHFIPDSEICKDIVSDAFRHLWEKAEDVVPQTVLSYMFTYVRNQCIDHIRHSHVEDSYVNEHLNLVSEMDDDAWEDTEGRIEKIMQIIDNLPPLTRLVMEQNYLHRKKYKEIAEMIEISESGVRKHVMKGLEIIRKEFSVNYKKGGNQN
jgi:RNA polymerase sigma-70 factor (ECF subfamily)